MGTPKALIDDDGVTWLARAVAVLREVTGRVPLVSLPHPACCPPELAKLARRLAPGHVVHDAEPDRGPVAGVVAALAACAPGDDALLWLAVDMPRVTAATLRDFLERIPPHAAAAYPVYRGHAQPACGLFELANPLPPVCHDGGLRGLLAYRAAVAIPMPRRAGGSPWLSIDTPGIRRRRARNVSRPAPTARSKS